VKLDDILSAFLAGVIGVAILTTILGRSNTARVLDAAGNAGSRLISSALGAGVELR
jgi:hypothetical protein